jgi:hypothetical protein
MQFLSAFRRCAVSVKQVNVCSKSKLETPRTYGRKGGQTVASIGAVIGLVAASLLPFTQASASNVADQPLRIADFAASGAVYSFPTLATCDVVDGIEIMKNTGSKPLRIVHVTAVIPTGSVPPSDKISYQLRSFRQGSTTGAVGNVQNMPVLGGQIVGSAVDQVLQPIASSSRWYIVLIRIKVVQPRTSGWAIRGLKVEYSVGAKGFSTVLKQTVLLPRTDC